MYKLFTITILSLSLLIWTGVDAPAAFETAMQAEAGKITAPAKIIEHKGAFGGKCIGVSEGGGSHSGLIEYQISFPEDGTYYIYGRVIAPDGGSDSFYVTWDAEDKGDQNGTNVWDVGQGGDWHWDMVMGRNLADPRPFDLKKGKHTLRMWIREDGAMLDSFIITPKDNYPVNDTKAMDTTYATPVEPKGKIAVTWSNIKSGH